MLLSHLKRLCISSVFLIVGISTTAAPTLASTPSSFADAVKSNVPSCAQSCLLASLDEVFPVACTAPENLQCLCSRYGSTGESLGEVAVACVYSSCQNLDQIGAAYNICLGQKDAVRPTKTALTITTAVSSGPRTTSSTVTSSAVQPSTTLASSRLSLSYTSNSAFVDSISSMPTATATATASITTAASPPPAAPADQDSPKMTPAQIAGLSVAAVAAFVMAIGLMALSVCLRRRRERKFDGISDEKGQGKRRKKLSGRFSHYTSVQGPPAPPKDISMLPPPTQTKPPAHANGPFSGTKTIRPVQRLGVGTSNSSSNSSLPLDQIGLAISAELDGRPLVRKTSVQNASNGESSSRSQPLVKNPPRPVSTLTQDTVFEEDDAPTRRRSSLLLPTPPVPIPPIRNLHPSRQPPPPVPGSRKSQRGSELFLNIPVRHQRPQPKRMDAASDMSRSLLKPTEPSKRPQLGPAIVLTSTSSSSESRVHTASSRNGSHDGDIIDYYFTTHRDSSPRVSPAQPARLKEPPQTVQSKKSLSTVSRTASVASTNIRDSVSSQTSFETSDPNDTTPEDDDDDKQLSDDKQQLSPVAESPIAGLKYPKVPRSANQLVPRSPRSAKNGKKGFQRQRGPRPPVEPSALLSKRNNTLPPLLLESRPRLHSPQRDPFVSPPRRTRGHIRSVSTDSWTGTPASKIDRKSKVQSGAWGKSAVMYEVDVIKPLNVRRRRDEMQEVNIGRDVVVDSEALKSPLWVPRLTPTRKGEDLFISVGWGDGRR